MVEIKPFKGTRPYNEDAKNLIAPSTDHLSIENIEIFKKNNYWNYLKILNPVGQLKEADTLLEAKSHFKGTHFTSHRAYLFITPRPNGFE